jgi:putative DNA primase/helicase
MRALPKIVTDPPEALRAMMSFRNWVVWKYETIDGKLKKPPYSPKGFSASTKNPKDWGSFEEACAAYRAGGYDGVGFVLTNTRFGALDPDGCVSRDANGNPVLLESARKLVEACRAYVEISPSGKGLRILGYVHGKRVHSSIKQGDFSLELFRNTSAYVTLTGEELEGYVGQPLANIDPHIDRLNAAATPVTKEPTEGARDNDSYEYPRRSFASDSDAERAIVGKIAIRGRHGENVPEKTVEALKIVRQGVPDRYDRSAAFQSIVNLLYRLGFASDDMLALFEKYPEGVAQRFTDEGRLEDETNRSFTAAATYEANRIKTLLKWAEPTGANSNERPESSQGANDVLAPKDSEEVLALAFAAEHKRYLRFVAKWKMWLIFKGGVWREDKTLRVREAIRVVCRDAGNACNDYKEAKKIASFKTVASVENMAKSDRQLTATIDQWDADPWLLNTPGGVVDLRTGKMREARGEDYMSKMTSVAPSDGDCPMWKSVLNTSFNGDEDMIAYIQRLLGYCLTGVTREHAMFFLYGQGRNGKGVIVTTTSRIMGDYAVASAIETFTASKFDRHPTELARLVGARLVTAAETEKGRAWAESRIKTLTGGDPLTARFMHKDEFTYDPQFKLMFHGNHKPSLGSVNEAIKARFHLVPFDVIVPEDQRDVDLVEKLKAEHGAILKWLIDGCLEYQRIGLKPPVAAQRATAEYLSEEDSIASWIDARCKADARAKALLSELFESWRGWAESMKEETGTKKTLSEALTQHGFKKSRAVAGVIFEGLRVKTNAELEADREGSK